jgi:hypothetical protein
MDTIRKLFTITAGGDSSRTASGRPRVRREPMCENLEGRQLLSTAASSLASGMPPWGNPGSFSGGPGGPPSSAQIAHFDGKGGPGGPAGRGMADFAHNGKAGSFTPKAMSAALKADFTTLQTDEAQLQSEVPATVTAAVTADQTTISTALASLPRPKLDAKVKTMTNAPSSTSPPSMTSMLEKAGISATEATQVSTDFQTYQTDLKTIDPTLQTKITADQTAITNDGGPTLPTGAAFPGGPMNAPPTS